MELTETIETLNKSLRDLYGIDTVTGDQMWRVSWSDSQLEKRYGTYEDWTASGIFIRRVTEVREVQKYQHVRAKYILEHLVVVPDVSMAELPVAKVSYECLHVFQDAFERYLPPHITICKLIIALVETAMQRSRDGLPPIKKFFDEEFSQEASEELKEKRIRELMNELHGDESGLYGVTTNESGSATFMPKNYEKGK